MGELSRKLENVKGREMNSAYSHSCSSSDLLNNYHKPLLTHVRQQFLISSSQSVHQRLNFPSNISQSSSSFPLSSSSPCATGPCPDNNTKSNGGRKRKRKEEKEMEKPKEVIHVRAKRGQATDSHSLAERVRREKINEKLRCLQDLVPGCYKTMGMAVMLDVIITYVQSLQNQIEFLSMKLSAAAASVHYDLNLERHTIETMQQATNAYELQEMEKIEREQEYGGAPNYFYSADWAL